VLGIDIPEEELIKELDSPEPLQLICGEMSLHLQQLNRLFKKVLALEGLSKGQMQLTIPKLQAEFNSHLASMRKTEDELLRRERDLRSA
jgi:hypothetical protein